ncbi:porin family protein [Flavobacterium dankookense]|uniref:Outer membrane protein with beta-barrel domain n=1 Tax=Flavobacterium dankookense TaxID=706186 RepID=A0A4R6Q8D2_9FLAO|nr:porin family protein [Flavobacterium dankookense]TDP58798.1 outer membrane protein with beta-barrel domain [Flavobacterium dankookense]
MSMRNRRFFSKNTNLFFIIFFLVISLSAQQKEVDFDAVDSLYREDQFYVNVSYCTLLNQPDGLNQNKFSPGISLGFLRDMPINKDRTIAIAVGLGYSLNTYNQNLLIEEVGDDYTYAIFPEADGVSYSKDRFSFHTVDLPIEFRWRNSTPESYKFWRVYAGFKFSYLFYDQYKIESTIGDRKISNNKDLNQFQYGTYLSVGWNTVNLYAYYGLNPLFKSSAKIDGEALDISALHFGLMFYIL